MKIVKNKGKLAGGKKKDWRATEVGEILRRKVRGSRRNITHNNVTIEGDPAVRVPRRSRGIG